MADRENIEADGGSGSMGAILGMILGVLVVGGLIFFFTGGWDRGGDTRTTMNPPSASETTGSSAPSTPATPSNPAR